MGWQKFFEVCISCVHTVEESGELALALAAAAVGSTFDCSNPAAACAVSAGQCTSCMLVCAPAQNAAAAAHMLYFHQCNVHHAMLQVGSLIASLIMLGIRSLGQMEQLLSEGLRAGYIPAAQRHTIRTAMLANLRQVAAGKAAQSIAKATSAGVNMPAVRAAILHSIPAIAAGKSCWLSASDQAWPCLPFISCTPVRLSQPVSKD